MLGSRAAFSAARGQMCDGSASLSAVVRLRGGSIEAAVSIPRAIKVLNRATLGERWPYPRGAATVTFEKGSSCTRIDDSCFRGCALESIAIPSSVEVLRPNCFSEATIKAITFDAGSRLKLIEFGAFSHSSLPAIVIPKSVEVIARKSFFRCLALASIAFEDGSRLRQIDAKAFYGCPITSISIPRDCQVIGSRALTCPSLSSISFHGSANLKRIEAFALSGSAVASVAIPSGVVEVNGTALFNARSVTSGSKVFVVESDFVWSSDRKTVVRYLGTEKAIVVPPTVEVIGPGCFARCKLESVSFGGSSSLRRIDDYAFCGSGLKALEVPASCESVAGSAFPCLTDVSVADGSTSLVCEQVSFELGTSFLLSFDRSRLIRFYGAIAAVTVPRQVSVIGSQSFFGCDSLTTVSFDGPSQVTRIESKAFAWTGLTAIAIPQKVEIIGSKSFSGCQYLTQVAFENGSQLKEIHPGAFSWSPLFKIDIPETVERIGASAFYFSFVLGSVLIGGDSQLKRIESKAFFKTTVRSATLPAQIAFVAGDAFPPDCGLTAGAAAGFADWNGKRPSDLAVDFDVSKASAKPEDDGKMSRCCLLL